MKKIMFICAMMFVSVQAMNAAEKTASDKVAPKASKECVAEKPEAPCVENCEECDALVQYRFLTSCGKHVDVPLDENTSKENICKYMAAFDKLFCPQNEI